MVKQTYMRLVRDAMPLVAAIVLISAGPSAYAATLNCVPSVDVETKSCGVADHIQTFARVTNKCSCDVNVSVQLPGGGAAVFTGVKRMGGSQREMIVACSPKKGAIGEYKYDFACPEGSTESKPRDLSKQLQSASTDAQDAAAKNRQDLSQLNKQHQQAADSEIARYKAGVRNWCASQAQNCDAKCVSKSRGSQNYMSACVNLCRTLVDACASDDGSQSAQAEARIRAANDNMKDVVDQLNRQSAEQRAREEMESSLQVQTFVGALSGMARAYQRTSGGNSGGGGAGRAPHGGGSACGPGSEACR
ncbi:hypothetical protein SAMN05444164_0674 [Bradyrhizobium erythrophlei]|uniref:Uncharacterized protein n=1 Tax=Bradyrhizobium erythrophlei TaxID=1437360 RepID=A0A1H4NMK3_9BRAD|nr:hypothetical protein SAMN05444164_0674 [Bradyrhizobium erythrophlei]